jgi:hypothetical protein
MLKFAVLGSQQANTFIECSPSNTPEKGVEKKSGMQTSQTLISENDFPNLSSELGNKYNETTKSCTCKMDHACHLLWCDVFRSKKSNSCIVTLRGQCVD